MIEDTWEYLKDNEYNREDHSLLLLKLKLFGKRKERTPKMYLKKENEKRKKGAG